MTSEHNFFGFNLLSGAPGSPISLDVHYFGAGSDDSEIIANTVFTPSRTWRQDDLITNYEITTLQQTANHKFLGWKKCKITTGRIPVQNGDILYVKNLDISTNVYSGIYKSDYSAIAGFNINESATHVKDVDLSGEWEQFTINNSNAGFIRITGAPSIFKDTNGRGFWGKYDVTQLNIIVNIKRNGEWL